MKRRSVISFFIFALAVALLTTDFAIANHRFIANEGRKLCIFDVEGELEWEMELKQAPHDLHQLPNGNILTHQGTELVEINIAKKDIVWSFDAKTLATVEKVEVHSVQPIPDSKIMVALSGEGKIFEIDRTGKVEHTISMTIDKPHPHRDTRLVRRLENGNYLVAHEGDGVIREYDRDSQVVWEFAVPLFNKQPKKGHGPDAFGNQAFAAIRLPNGNTMIATGNGHSIIEVTHDKEIVWKLEQYDLASEGDITLAWITTLEVHPNGHIVFGNCHAGPGNPQLIEINRKKVAHWWFMDFKNLGNNVSNSQILDAETPVIR